MEKAIQTVENKIKEVEKYTHIDSFKSRLFVLNDILKKLN